jgi:predicted naringenin-chalcone synthase
MSRIINIATAVPEHCHDQSKIAEFMSHIYQEESGEDNLDRKLKLLYERSGIKTRYSVLPDFSCDKDERTFIPRDARSLPWPEVQDRMDYYNKSAIGLAKESLVGSLDSNISKNQITHLITVSCTGMSAPGIDIELIQALDLNSNIDRTSVNFMGCYAAIHGLKQADYICRADKDAVVALVCVEICTLHFQNSMDKDHQTANMIFADGAASCLIVGDNVSIGQSGALSIDGFYSDLAFKGKSDMAWNITSKGFQMVLSSYIPDLIKSDIKKLVDAALDKFNLNQSSINHWAVHPGGKKILEVVSSELKLNQGELESSYDILKNYGNMSSSTILFVLKEIFENKSAYREINLLV